MSGGADAASLHVERFKSELWRGIVAQDAAADFATFSIVRKLGGFQNYLARAIPSPATGAESCPSAAAEVRCSPAVGSHQRHLETVGAEGSGRQGPILCPNPEVIRKRRELRF